MKRFRSLTTTTALVGVLIGAGSAAFADRKTYNLYLQPISPLNASYAPGDTITFRAVVDILPNNNPTALTFSLIIAYDLNIFDTYLIDATADISPYPPKPSQHLWNTHDKFYYGQTQTGPTGDPLATFAFGVGHAPAWLEPNHILTTIPAGTYTISTFSFPVLATVLPGPTTLYLPTAFGFGGGNVATDTVNANDAGGMGNQILAFPNDGVNRFSSLTYTIANTNNAIISGNLTFASLLSGAAAQHTTFVFRPTDNSGDVTLTSSVAPSGAFSFSLPRKNYILHVKSDKYLAANVPVDATNGSVSGLNIPLTAGDANNDNEVGLGDFSVLVDAYGSSSSAAGSGYNSSADFNGDGLVDILDFNILVNSYTLKGKL